MFPPLETMSILILQTSPATSGGQMEGQRCRPCGVFGNLISFSLPPLGLFPVVFVFFSQPTPSFAYRAGTFNYVRAHICGYRWPARFLKGHSTNLQHCSPLNNNNKKWGEISGHFHFFFAPSFITISTYSVFFTVRCF